MIRSITAGLRRVTVSGSSSPVPLRMVSTSRATLSEATAPTQASPAPSDQAPSPAPPAPAPSRSLPGSSSSAPPPPPPISALTRRTAYSSLRGHDTPPFRLHIQSTRTNTILTLTDPYGNVLSAVSGGSLGTFKKAARSGYEAAYRASLSMFNTIANKRIGWRMNKLELVWKGFGQGREAVFRALMANEGRNTRLLVSRMSDATKIKVGGVRPKKRRML
ncbi:translational machinery component [Acaromyces ingoldii]|uniref:Translational machinery component n=1 Tax=Acaromyces ingoldii TaxID=215250 RepID=A0A316YTM5_9BASI|nr:translational machinery component [Acaromyces ingoldii]PWN92767.1 translational machinery component [Acaromyces ingoldii]